jgi:hypothetical protein
MGNARLSRPIGALHCEATQLLTGACLNAGGASALAVPQYPSLQYSDDALNNRTKIFGLAA